jgi:hypothetical protein
VLTREEVERVHAGDLVRGVARHRLEIAVPAQEASAFVVEVEDARQALDHRLREQPLASRLLFRALMAVLENLILERDRDVARRPLEQRDLLVAKGPRRVGVGAECAENATLHPDRNDGGGAIAAPDTRFRVLAARG